MKQIKESLKKIIGKYLGWYCEYCGARLDKYNYNFHERCPNGCTKKAKLSYKH